MRFRQGLVIALLVASRVGAEGYDPGTAFSDGKALGTGSIDRAFQGIGSGTGAATVPGFGGNTPQSQHFQSGQGQLSGPGSARIAACASLPPDADAYRRQECDAVNFVARNPAVRPAFSIDRANDPLISRANAQARNPTVISTGMTAGSGAEPCRVVTETTPASFTRETCTDYRPVDSRSCSTARQINVDQQHHYQCVEQVQAVIDSSCFIGQQIAVSKQGGYKLTTDRADTSACDSYAHNARCRLAAHSCVDATPCKVDASGATVCLAGVTPPVGGLNSTATCWRYQEDYACIADHPVDDCAAIKATQGCALAASICDRTAFDGSCNQYTRTYQCTHVTVSANPPTVVELDTSYTITSNTLDTSGCTSLAQSNNCVHAAQTCTDETPCKTINGLQVCLNTVSPLPAGAQSAGDSCWAWSEDYSCAATTLGDDCQDLIDRGCSQVASECLERLPSGACDLRERTYSCETSPAVQTQRTVCDQRSFCKDGAGCFDTSHPADEDFGKVIAAMEAAREAGVYGADQELFKGVPEHCRKKLFGLANCCKKSGGGAAKSNHTLMSATLQGAYAGGQLAVNAGSKYVFDFMYPQYAGYVEAGAQAMISSEVLFTPTNFQPSFSFYGLTFSTGTMTSGLLGGPIFSLGSLGPFNFYFDPYTLVIAVAIQLISELFSCEQSEQLLAMHRDANLCVPVGSFCSKRLKVLKTCVEQTQTYCCFNSRLARMINEQGRGQLGKGWGIGKYPDCSGFTPAEFEQIDFSRIDLSEFIAEIAASVRVPSASEIGQNVQGTVQQRVHSYYRP